MQNLVLDNVSACDHPPHLGVVVGVRGLVLFDFGGTLDADGSRWSVRFHAAYRSVGGKQSFAAFDRAFRESDRALERLSGIERLGFRAMVDAQTALLLPRLSQHALSHPGLTSKPAWMVGDNFESDIRPAAALGLSTAWLAPATEKSNERDLPTVRLTTLSDLARVLES